ncbi:N-acetylmuramoyl-L-alanine amidase [Neobacillus drentensis]|uniref:N-acetylmuramoyl-L-alanine amidase n=1 Tax=Neobacillus drentensis TaxID=220684 RepID=UPI002FFF974E
MRYKIEKIGLFVVLLLALIVASFYFYTLVAKGKMSKEQFEQPVVKEGKVKSESDKGQESVSSKNNVENKESVVSNKGNDGGNNKKPEKPLDTSKTEVGQVKQKEANPVSASSGRLTPEQSKAAYHDFSVVIDPGHQQKANLEKEPVGPGSAETKVKVTGGTTGIVTGKPEYVLALEASLILGDLLEKRGVKVIYTRSTHNVNLSNRERAEIANQQQADFFIRIHADGSTDRNVRGLSILTPAGNDPYTKAIYQDSLQASQYILEETKKNASLKVNGISYRGDLSGFNWSKVPATLVEMGFMSNPTEDRNLSDPVYLTNLLTNVADGIIRYADYKKE